MSNVWVAVRNYLSWLFILAFWTLQHEHYCSHHMSTHYLPHYFSHHISIHYSPHYCSHHMFFLSQTFSRFWPLHNLFFLCRSTCSRLPLMFGHCKSSLSYAVLPGPGFLFPSEPDHEDPLQGPAKSRGARYAWYFADNQSLPCHHRCICTHGCWAGRSWGVF